ncbi:hypothetical protein [Vulcanisaeta distributa]|uniref:hypothetical protein n=1 Tax=Vulcanisaeta distributa TaxID=164451 RepID=UPI001FB4B12F|nr:hypothetical protein [Vulcanisaeta distributa]
MYIRGININEDDVSISWFLRANDYTSIKGKILNDTDKLHNKAVLAFIFTAILGDGAVFISSSNKYNEAKIQITMSVHELERWKLILDKLGFKWSLQPQLDGIIHVRFHGSKAIDLARAIINIIPPILRDILDVLNIEKWSNLKQIANMELKFRKGESQIDVAGEKFSVVIDNNKIKLMRTIKDWTKVEKILEKIKIIYGEDFVKQVKVHKSNKYIIIKIPMKLIKEHDDIKVQVIQALRRKYERINDNKRKRVIIKHLRKLIEGQS